MVLRLIRDLVTGLFCHRRRAGLLPAEPGRAGTRLAQLDASVGASGPHDFSVRGSLLQKPRDELGTNLAEAFAKAVQRRPSARRVITHGLSSAPCDPRSRARRCRVHRIPHSTSVTIAKRPSMRGGTSEVVKLIWVFREAIYFCAKGWTGFCDDCPSGKSVGEKPVRWGKNRSSQPTKMVGVASLTHLTGYRHAESNSEILNKANPMLRARLTTSKIQPTDFSFPVLRAPLIAKA
jgi:hypothetical protein